MVGGVTATTVSGTSQCFTVPLKVVIVACTVTDPTCVTLMVTGQLFTIVQLFGPMKPAPAVLLSRLHTTSKGCWLRGIPPTKYWRMPHSAVEGPVMRQSVP